MFKSEKLPQHVQNSRNNKSLEYENELSAITRLFILTFVVSLFD